MRLFKSARYRWSTHIRSKLSRAKDKISPSIDYFIEYISCGATPRVSTPFLEVFYLPPGSEVEYSTMRIDPGKEQNVACPQFLDALQGRLKKILTGDKRIFIHRIKCRFVVGVQTNPFISHAWVEGENGVVFDRKELPEELAKIVSIGGINECSIENF